MKNTVLYINNHLTMKEYLLALLVSALTVIAPIKAFVITIGLFVLFDTAIAIYWTVTTKGWSSFRSNKLFNFVVKTFFYMSGILLAFLVDTYIFEGSLMGIKLLLTKAMSLLWIFIELKSIDETSIKLGNKSIWVHFKELFAKGKEFKKDLGDIIEDDKKD
jgi:uncharacterized membrane protein SirB2